MNFYLGGIEFLIILLHSKNIEAQKKASEG